MRLTPYRRVVVFHFRRDFQHGPRAEPPAVRSRGLDERLNAFLDHRSGTVGPSDLSNGKTRLEDGRVKLEFVKIIKNQRNNENSTRFRLTFERIEMVFFF